MSIRTYIITFLACSMLALVAGVYVCSRYIAAQKADVYFERDAAALLDSVDELAALRFAEAKAVTASLANLQEVRDAYKSLPRRDDKNPVFSPDAFVLQKRLQDILPLLPQTTALFVATNGGGYMQHPPEEESSPLPVPEFEGKTSLPMSVPYIAGNAGSVAVLIAAPVKAPDGNPAGIAGISLSLGPMTNALLDLRLGKSGRVMMFDGEGRVMVSSLDPAAALLPAEDPLTKAAAASSGFFTATLDGKEYTGYSRKVRDTPWKAAVYTLRTDAGAEAGAAESLKTASIAGAFACLVFLAGLIGAWRVTRPFDSFRQKLDAVTSGDYESLGKSYAAIPELAPLLAGMHHITTHLQRLGQEHAGKLEDAEQQHERAKTLSAKAEEAARDAEKSAAKAQAEAAAAIAKAQAEAKETVAKTRAEADAAITQTRSEAEAAVAQTRSEAETLVAKIRAETEAFAAQTRAEAEAAVTKAQREATEAVSQTSSRAVTELQAASGEMADLAARFDALASGFDGITDKIALAAEEHTAAVTARDEENIRELSSALHDAHISLKNVTENASAAQEETGDALRMAEESVFILHDMKRTFEQASELLSSRMEKMRSTERTARSLHEALRGIDAIGGKINLLAFDTSIKASAKGEDNAEMSALAADLRTLAGNTLSASSAMNGSLSDVAKSLSSAITGLTLMQSLLERSSGVSDEAATKLEASFATAKTNLANAAIFASAAEAPLPIVDIDEICFPRDRAAVETPWGESLRGALDEIAVASQSAHAFADMLKQAASAIQEQSRTAETAIAAATETA